MATSIQLTPEDEMRLELLVSRTSGTKDFYLREIIECGLEDLEDYYLASDVLVRLGRKVEGIYTDSEARKALDLGD
ncbi:MAG: CopG family transcriptional regulator [Gemmatimonadetes bacterium]|nr:CopG family transcriptional regulator [Gemmatimonadota bacterium]MYB59923.1 CopG family transcriptional regulator [Gemmatimonadota bacterium]